MHGRVWLNIEIRDIDEAVGDSGVEPGAPLTLVTDVRGKHLERAKGAEFRIVDRVLAT